LHESICNSSNLPSKSNASNYNNNNNDHPSDDPIDNTFFQEGSSNKTDMLITSNGQSDDNHCDVKVTSSIPDAMYEADSDYSSTEGQCDPGEKDNDSDSDNDGPRAFTRKKKDNFKFGFQFSGEDLCVPCNSTSLTDAMDSSVATLVNSLGCTEEGEIFLI